MTDLRRRMYVRNNNALTTIAAGTFDGVTGRLL